ncbi:hypothetical protein [Sphingomonas sanxanigenens]|uniref:Uncharacterized protein n=1 Tax=Sphingomonas sanxanigenens DSM 19645 = NX02 TaxID=1123269 RepID=W0AAG0_9SPHN|nr:hypothetical protein [Sphingomonas sanxanigenens]AHE52645.1 hypothetical protein NX02_04505 [Sphingomonas sanxanigenens DSM 19645 = NX02]
MTERVDLAASRNVDPWGDTIDFIYSGAPLPPITSIDMEVRLYPGAPGAALLTPTVTFEDLADPTEEDPLQRILRVMPSAPQSALEGMPTGLNQPDPGDADLFSHDIIITYADTVEEKLGFGDFLLQPGVTV